MDDVFLFAHIPQIEYLRRKDTLFSFDLEDLTPPKYVAETLTYGELMRFISREEVRGSSNINRYKVVQELLKYYTNWKAKNIEIVYISIDTDKTAFESAYKSMPWQSYCDYKGWETQAAKDYYISGTPSYFLLEATNKILLRPNSLAHANAWIVQNL